MFGGIPKSEIDVLDSYWQSFPNLKSELFENETSPYTHLNTNDIKQTIMQSQDIKGFISNFNASFKDFNAFLKSRLLEELNFKKY